ncbi:hypothetical protein TB2_002496 [Malus domestica]
MGCATLDLAGTVSLKLNNDTHFLCCSPKPFLSFVELIRSRRHPNGPLPTFSVVVLTNHCRHFPFAPNQPLLLLLKKSGAEPELVVDPDDLIEVTADGEVAEGK